MLAKTLLILGFLIIAESAVAKTVGMMLVTHPDKVHPAEVEFYRETERALASNPDIKITTLGTNTEAAGNHIAKIGAITTLERREFYRRTKSKKMRKKMIVGVQRILDTRTVDAMLLVDCRRIRGLIRKCGIYFYDREESRVTAAAEKNFKAGVMRAETWAPILANRLIGSMQARAQMAERKKVMSAVQAMGRAEDRADFHWSLKLASGRSTVGSSSNLVPRLGLGLAQRKNGFEYGAYAEVSRASNQTPEENEVYHEIGGGFEMRASSRALSDLSWSLALNLGFVRTQFTQTSLIEADSAVTDQLSASILKLGGGPQMSWHLGKKSEIGTGVNFYRYVPLKTNVESGSMQDMRASGAELGIFLNTKI